MPSEIFTNDGSGYFPSNGQSNALPEQDSNEVQIEDELQYDHRENQAWEYPIDIDLPQLNNEEDNNLRMDAILDRLVGPDDWGMHLLSPSTDSGNNFFICL